MGTKKDSTVEMPAKLDQSTSGNNSPAINSDGDVSVSYGLSEDEYKIEKQKDRNAFLREIRSIQNEKNDKFFLKENKKLVRLIIDNIEYNEFGARESNTLRHGIANFLDIPVEKVIIDMIKKGSTKVFVELPEDIVKILSDEKLQELKGKLSNLFRVRSVDTWQTLKRRFAFDLLDSFLSLCMEGICPVITSEHCYYLADISLDGYISQRSYYYYNEGIGRDNADRHYMAKKRVEQIFKCKVKPDLDENVFVLDRKQVNEEFYHSSRNRKAFWRSLSRRSRKKKGDAHNDYFAALEFMDTMNKLYKDAASMKVDLPLLDETRELLNKNTDMCNAIEMYSYCFFRQQFCCKSI